MFSRPKDSAKRIRIRVSSLSVFLRVGVLDFAFVSAFGSVAFVIDIDFDFDIDFDIDFGTGCCLINEDVSSVPIYINILILLWGTKIIKKS